MFFVNHLSLSFSNSWQWGLVTSSVNPSYPGRALKGRKQDSDSAVFAYVRDGFDACRVIDQKPSGDIRAVFFYDYLNRKGPRTTRFASFGHEMSPHRF